MSKICTNLETVNKKIERACAKAGRSPDEVQLVAISKTKPLDDIKAAFESGQIHFGENRAKELQDKMENFVDDKIQWHMVGTLQTNKIKYMIERVNWIDSVPKKKTLKEIEKRASRAGRTINALIQVNISGESQKSGCKPKQLKALLDYSRELEHVKLRGLMGMATFTDAERVIRNEFKQLKKLFETYKSDYKLDQLSMGMTNDMEIALEEGSTMVRVGRAIFGERNY